MEQEATGHFQAPPFFLRVFGLLLRRTNQLAFSAHRHPSTAMATSTT